DDFVDVQVDLLARPHLQFVLQPLHLGALAADDDAGPRGEDRDARAVGGALDVDLGDAGVVELVLDVAPDLHVLVEQLGVVLGGEPPGAPRPGRAQPKADRVRLLTHAYVVSLRVRVLGLGAAPVVARVPRRRRRSAVDARALAAGAGIVVEGEG